MTFDWTAEEQELFERTLQAARRADDTARRRGFLAPFGREEWRACGELGLLGFNTPREYGGLGCDCLSTAHQLEAFGRGCEDMGLVFGASAQMFACAAPIAEFGSDDLRRRLLPGLASGALIGANAITEANAGSDSFALETEAVLDGDSYVLNGTKTYVTNMPLADVVVVYASTSPRSGYLGVTAFAIETAGGGLTVGEPFAKSGLHSLQASALRLENCRVPRENRLGDEGAGARIFQRSMAWERTCLLAGYVGMMERQLEATIEHARSRRQFGRPISRNQGVSHTIADMKLRLEGARLLLYRACWKVSRGEAATLDVALCKLAISEAAMRSSIDAVQLFGGAGFLAGSGVERGVGDALGATIASGTSNMQRETIVRELGL